ncbi:MAG: flavin reductase family protein [Dehalococcoidia bacterium]|nr:flavin reductase family protein [Dehalococcoidia bacterium]
MAFKTDFPSIPGEPKELDPKEQAMLAMSYGVHVIGSVDSEGSMNAMIADWVMQVSFKPRLVGASIENDARTLRYIRETNVFSVNMLHELDGMDIARAVVMPAEGRKVKGRSEEAQSAVHHKLEGLRYEIYETGVPILLDSLGWYTCDVKELVQTGDHTLVIGEVTDGGILRSGEMLIERDLGWEYAG